MKIGDFTKVRFGRRPAAAHWLLALPRMGAACWLALAISACGNPASNQPEVASDPNANSQQHNSQDTASRSEDDDDTWAAVFIHGAKAGFQRVNRREFQQDGLKQIRIETVLQLSVIRGGRQIDQRMQLVSIESPEGRLTEFTTRIELGGRPQVTTGRVEADQLVIEMATGGQPTQHQIPWAVDIGGFSAMDESLLRKPMRPGEQRTIRHLSPLVYQVATVELEAADYETVRLLGDDSRLLRVDATTTLPGGQELKMIIWTDENGQVFKSHDPASGLELIRTSRENATSNLGGANFDLLFDTMVHVDPPLVDPHNTRRIRYRVRLDGGDPVKAFADGPSQRVVALGAGEAEVTVYALRPDSTGSDTTAAAQPPTAEESQANRFIESDDGLIRSLARRAAGDEDRPWPLALSLERFVHDYMTRTGTTQAFATAADVAASRSGDCTEYAVLLAALARARGIPARVVIGLVHTRTESGGGFAYHMWNELYILNRWIPMDGTLGLGGIGGGHLKLAHSSLGGVDALASFLPVVQVMGRLEVEVLEVE